MATHYPPYLLSPDEVGHYDNVDPPARGWLLELLRRHRVEALFCGHVHNLFYHRLDGTEIYLLPSPSFVRRDYSELYPVEARNEFGRNDVGKLGCFWVDVYESGHVARLIRTAGRCGTDAGDGASPTARLVVPGHPKDPGEARFGVHLRHPWSPLVELPYTPPVDAFARRVVRNDAPLQALWDLGVRDVRIPVADLADARLVARLEDLVAVGMRITVFSAGLPDAPLLASLASATGLLVRWECVLPWAEAPRLVERAAAVVTESGLELAIADLRSAAVGNAGRPAGKHFTAPGFLPGETALAEACLDACPPGVIGAVVFRGEQGGIDDTALAAIAAFARARRVRAVVTWTVMPDGPNDAELDPARVEQSIRRLDAAAQRFPELAWMLDDFVDVDRGYYPRVALVDRRAEPNPAGEWMRRGRAGAATAPSTGF